MNTVVKMLITLTFIGIVSGGALSQIDSWAAPKIAHHRKVATEKAIYLVQPDAKDYKKIEDAPMELYEVFDENNESIGYASVFEGNGFQGVIRIMVGIKSDMKTLTSIQILEQVETPGLGTKITEDPFQNKFKELVADPGIVPIKGAEANNPGEVQTITGATISSKAVCEIINTGLANLRNWKGGTA